MESIGIIGQGRFGCLLKKILSREFDVKTCDLKINNDVLKQKNIFIAVPINAFKDTIENITQKLTPHSTIIDTCSVKIYPVKTMLELLPPTIDIIATHPLFGPDSFENNPHKKIMLAKIRDQHKRFDFWQQFFIRNAIETIEMTPEEHDKYIAESQGITHLIGRTLEHMNAQSTPINTAGFEQLLKIMQHTCNDSVELFNDLQRFNPYSKIQNKKILNALKKVIKGSS